MNRAFGVSWNILVLLLLLMPLIRCSQDFTPKPKAYPRIDFPDKSYILYRSGCPFEFEHLKYSKITFPPEGKDPCWLNIDYPFLKSRIHISYKKIENNLSRYMEDTRTLAYKHTIKANAIEENNYLDSTHHVYAKIYRIKGDVASAIQFYATDSLDHFIRGALYFNASANEDSLRPAINYIDDDIKQFIRSLKWK